MAVSLYCGDCGTLLAPASGEGCCVNIDRQTGQPRRAGVLPPLQWSELDNEEQALVVALLTFAKGEAGEGELLQRLDWTSELLSELVVPVGQNAAQMACCIRCEQTLRLTDQARDAFIAHLHAVGAQIEGAHRSAA